MKICTNNTTSNTKGPSGQEIRKFEERIRSSDYQGTLKIVFDKAITSQENAIQHPLLPPISIFQTRSRCYNLDV